MPVIMKTRTTETSAMMAKLMGSNEPKTVPIDCQRSNEMDMPTPMNRPGDNTPDGERAAATLARHVDGTHSTSAASLGGARFVH